MSQGIKNAGFKTLFATDVEPSAAKTFEHNFPDVPFHLGDIRRLTREQLLKHLGRKKIDLIVGGPPCQGFSTIGDQNPAGGMVEAGMFFDGKRQLSAHPIRRPL